ncbi:PP2C family protein-serine/threonine phosphatase [Actinacidiphila paucisporea]|uniref:PAS domain S-box-containing protein n=1 Tax=Actinacidiphila paucisporea TaxID=310782 RepID=A0A1M6XSV5_9ACTN|nr:SpoIIE family protein phosphatase [Actinacidiphila paucisporea]SHL08939.1 PAS domain S-box-containing protein [Actinacidiphila paucisporea]
MAGREGGTGLDYAALFAAVPAACVVLDRELTIVAANDAYVEVTGRPAADLTGRSFFEAFPPDPSDPTPGGAEAQRESLEAVLVSGQANVLLLQHYAIPRAGRAGEFEPRWWNVANQPLIGADGQVDLIIHRVEDVSDYVTSEHAAAVRGPDGQRMAAPHAELMSRVQRLAHTHSRLQKSTARSHDVALALQQAMLATPDLARHPEIAVRYRPAMRGMNACGDWYDVVDLPGGRFGLTVGDVVGHGVGAASVMGMLRSALSAAIRVADGPSGALEALGLYARSLDGATATTTFACQVFPVSRLLTYSSAGHPPPVLMHADGTYHLLDSATDPPLGVRLEHVPRPQATAEYQPGDLLVLYTDGLIERRGEDIDAGLARLVAVTGEFRHLPPEDVADGLLHTLANPEGQQDDISLMVTRF